MITIPPEGNVHVCTSYHSNSSSSCLRFRDQSFLSWAGQLTGCSVSSQVKSLVKAIQVRSASQPLTPDCNIKLWSMLDTDKSFESSFPKCSHKSLTAMLSVKSFNFLTVQVDSSPHVWERILKNVLLERSAGLPKSLWYCCLETVNVCDGVPIRVVDTETFLRMSENLLVEKETFRNHRTYEGSFETFH